MESGSVSKFDMISAYKPFNPVTKSVELEKLMSSLKKNTPKQLDYRKVKVRFNVSPRKTADKTSASTEKGKDK